jgi:hypothetical protein
MVKYVQVLKYINLLQYIVSTIINTCMFKQEFIVSKEHIALPLSVGLGFGLCELVYICNVSCFSYGTNRSSIFWNNSQ